MTTAREAIIEAYKGFEEAFFKGEADTISRMYTEDAEWLVPEAPIVKGREAIGQVWARIIGPGGKHGPCGRSRGGGKRRLGVRRRHIRGKDAGRQRSQRGQIHRDLEATIHG